MQKQFEFIEHTADIGIKVYGKTLEQLFENAAYAMYNIICEKFHNISPTQIYKNELHEVDTETLLISFLNDLLYQTFVNKLLFCKYNITFLNETKNEISFLCNGEYYSPQQHGKLTELKAATFHEFKIEKNSSGIFYCTIIFDT